MKVSVIIPTYHRDCVLDCVTSILNQNDAPEFEILVSARDIHLYLKLKLESRGVKVIHYNEPGNGPAKNYAAYFTRGEFIAFTDDDCLVNKYWLKNLMMRQSSTNADIVVGQCFPWDHANPYLVAHQCAIMYHLGDKNSVYDGEAKVGTTMNMLIRKETFFKLKGFSSTFSNQYGDDWDFNQRWTNNSSIKARYAPEAIVNHNHQLTFKKLMRLSFHYGMGAFHCSQLSLKRGITNNAHTPRSEYLSMMNFVKRNIWITSSNSVRTKAAWLLVLAHEVKHLGSLYARFNPQAPSKVY